MGLYYRERFSNGQEIAVWEITEQESELAALCLAAGHNPGEFSHTVNRQRRLERMAVRVLVDILFDRHTIIQYRDNGKPFLVHGKELPEKELKALSIAHTRRFACIVTAPGDKAGIDLECLSRNFEAVAKKALGKEEKVFLSDNLQQRTLQLALIWCAKEAMFKYMSQEEVDFSKQMTVAPFFPETEGVLSGTFQQQNGITLLLPLCYKKLDDHFMVWVTG
ncbi:MAG: 4-phosphopantetheinyl transferase family protein [Bacteroidales bacterium]|jgi:4'-phosphopantetheinyl transferase|nr:4'-phosphopantetheinyl transferase superfamily protein [Bacteroidales bacterium]NLK79163.1 4-phosphopantetheinyl transferase family protein [Bacteroidales bacterium]HKM31707.1 4'-phosphopantetheinyl transferase superfamily protein [Bacteroidales bacterium]